MFLVPTLELDGRIPCRERTFSFCRLAGVGRVSMNEAEITRYITENFEGVHPVDAWGDMFFFYNPDGSMTDEFYFATLKNKDDEGDTASKLDREGVFRLNIGVSKTTYRSLFGE